MKLFDVCEINPRQRGISDDTLVSFVAMPDVSEDGKINTSVIRPFSEVKKGYTVFQEGDILFAKITPCMENGKGALATGLKNGIGVGSTEFHVLRPNPGYVDGMWVYYLTAWPAFRREAESHMTGSAGQRRVPKSFLEEYTLSVPSLNTQCEQVEHLDRVNKIIEARKEQVHILDQLIKARFVEMFGTVHNNVFQFAEGTLESISYEFFAGGDKPEDCTKERDEAHPYPVFANGYENEGLQGYSAKCRVTQPAVTVSARGTIGYCFIREAGFTPVVRLVTIVPNNKVSPVFLKYAIDTMDIKSSGTSQA